MEVFGGVVVVMALIFTVKPIARQVFRVIRNKFNRATKLPIPLKKKSLNKFSEQAWQLVVHVGMTAYSLYVMRADVDDGASWWRDTRYVQYILESHARYNIGDESYQSIVRGQYSCTFWYFWYF